MYLTAVRKAFGWRVDYAQVVKEWAGKNRPPERERYSKGCVSRVYKRRLIGDPDMGSVSTSLVEWANLSLRMRVRRFTRLTDAFSKKAENHAHAVSLGFLSYNFCMPHVTLT